MSEFIVTPTRIFRRDSIAVAEHLAENGGASRVHITTTGGHRFSVADPDGAIWRTLVPPAAAPAASLVTKVEPTQETVCKTNSSTPPSLPKATSPKKS